MRSGWIAPLGPDVDAFERELAERVGVAHGVALSSGTAALHLGLLTLGVEPGDVVVTSTMTFAATANAIVYTGAEPYFIDCLPDDRQHGSGASASEALGGSPRRRRAGRARSCRSISSARPSTTRASWRSPTSSACRCSPTPPSRSAPRIAGQAGGQLRPRVDRVVQRQQDHDHVRRRHAADRRRATSPSTCATSRPRPASRSSTTSTPTSATTTA